MNKISRCVKVLHCSEMIKGGTASYLRELIPLQADSFGAANVNVLIPVSHANELPVPSGVKLEAFGGLAKGRFLNSMLLAGKALKIANREKIDVIHLHGTFAGFVIRPLFALLKPKIRVIYCPHGWAWDRTKSLLTIKLICLIERILALITDRIVCISNYEWQIAKDRAGIPANKLVLVRNAVSDTVPVAFGEEPKWLDGKLRILFVGRFDRQKGVDVLLSALEIMGDKVHAILVGGSVLEDTIETFVLPQNATLVGWKNSNQLQCYFDSANVFVMPSRWEGFGLIVAEAMRAGLPVVASKVGGLVEVVDDGVTGILVEPESPTALATAILSTDRESLIKMGKAGKERIAVNFSMQRLHDEMMDVYGF